MVFRGLAQSIAEEMLEKIACDDRRSIVVSVESARLTSITENAFLDVLKKKGCHGRIGGTGDSSETSLRVIVLGEELAYSELPSTGFARSIRIDIEARLQVAGEREAHILRNLTRETKDTVGFREEIPFLMKNAGESERSDSWQKILSPLIIIGASSLLIYLFFTVRS